MSKPMTVTVDDADGLALESPAAAALGVTIVIEDMLVESASLVCLLLALRAV